MKIWKKHFLITLLMLSLSITLAQAGKGDKGKPGGDGGGKDNGPADPVLLISELWASPLLATDADGQNQTKVIRDGTEQPAWSPDGRFAAFRGLETLLGVDCAFDVNVAMGMAELIDPATNSWGDPEFLFCLSGSSPAFSPVQIGDQFTLAFAGSITTEPGFDNNALPDLRTVQVGEVPGGGFVVSASANISDTLEIQEAEPTWSPDGSEIAVRTTDRSPGPDSGDWIHDLMVYHSDGLGVAESLIQGNGLLGTDIDPLIVEKVRSPEWSRTNSDVIAVAVDLAGLDGDIYCLDRNSDGESPPDPVNLTQSLDDLEGEIDDMEFAWLPDDSGIVVVRQGMLVEVRFNGTLLGGCPDPSDLTVRKLSQKRGSYYVNVDYLRFLWP